MDNGDMNNGNMNNGNMNNGHMDNGHMDFTSPEMEQEIMDNILDISDVEDQTKVQKQEEYYPEQREIDIADEMYQAETQTDLDNTMKEETPFDIADKEFQEEQMYQQQEGGQNMARAKALTMEEQIAFEESENKRLQAEAKQKEKEQRELEDRMEQIREKQKNSKPNIEKTSWNIIDKYFNSDPYILTRHHLNSFDEFISSKISATIKRNNPLIVNKNFNKSTEKFTYEIEVFIGGLSGTEIFIDKPTIYDPVSKTYRQLYPNEARLKNLTYASNIYANVIIKYLHRHGKSEDKYERVLEGDNRVCLGKIPIMVHSSYCVLHDMPSNVLEEMGEDPNERGGYFIIDGKEKVIISQERHNNNTIILKKMSDSGGKPDKFRYKAIVNSVLEYSFRRHEPFTLKMNTETKKIYAEIPMIRQDIPICVLFRALGIESDKEIVEMIFYTTKDSKMIELFRPSIEDSGSIFNQETALKHISNFRMKFQRNIKYLFNIFDRYLLPHVDDVADDDETTSVSFIDGDASGEMPSLQIDKNRHKCFYIGMMVNKLIKLSVGHIKETDIDSYTMKRVETSGALLAELFGEYYVQAFLKKGKEKNGQTSVERSIDNAYQYKILGNQDNITIDQIITPENRHEVFNQNIITTGFNRSLKHHWGLRTPLPDNRNGIVQDVNRLSYLNTMSMMRRITNPINSALKITKPRHLHTTQWGMVCPNETPDGGNIGFIKSLAISAYITKGEKSTEIVKVLLYYGVVSLDNIIPTDVFDNTKIIVNGRWIGIHDEPDKLVYTLRMLRCNGIINPYTSVAWNIFNRELYVHTDDGRIVRPLLIVNDNIIPDEYYDEKLLNKQTWATLLSGMKSNKSASATKSKGSVNIVDDYLENASKYQLGKSMIEYLDTDEIDGMLIATYPSDLTTAYKKMRKYTHCEIHPSFLFGLTSLCTPFTPHDQAPRCLYSTGQSKQAIGIYASNFRNRMDQTSYALSYPQKAIVHSRYSGYFGPSTNLYGHNVIVAIMSYTGYNQEDAIIFNGTSLQRGLFNNMAFKTYTQTIIYGTDKIEEFFGNPLLATGVALKQTNNYTKLDKRGIIREGEEVSGNDVIIGMMKTYKDNNGDEITIDASICPDKNTKGVVDKVFAYDDNGKVVYKVQIRTMCEPTLGDKFGSRHGIKGCIGLLIPGDCMPYTKDGVVPDLIINPHGMPSRMSMGHLIESIFGKNAVMTGQLVDSTAFSTIKNPMASINDLFPPEKNGYMDNCGDEIMYNGYDGRQMEGKIFIGAMYYMRLKQQVKDKIHSRGTGARQMMNRQPTQGRARAGGAKIGEMEQWCLLGHGISDFYKESLMKRSDEYSVHINKLSGLIEPYNPSQNIYASDEYSIIEIPYSFKLMMQELQTMNVQMRLIT